MSDRPLDPALEKAATLEARGLQDAALDPGKAGLDQLRALTRDTGSAQALEAKGVLPAVQLNDSDAVTYVAKNDVPSHHGIAADTNRGGKVGLETENTRVAQAGDGHHKHGHHTHGHYKETTLDNGTVVHEHKDHSVEIKLPHHHDWLKREPHYGSNGRPEKPISAKVDDEGTVTYKYKDGTVESIDKDGNDLKLIKGGPDNGGWGEIVYKDGTWFNESHEHTKWWNLTDNTNILQDKDGNVSVEDKDGNAVKPHAGPHGSKVWDLPNGTTVTEDKAGNIDWSFKNEKQGKS